MNIRKALLLVMILAIASLGLTLTGCEQKSEPAPAEQPAAKEAAADTEKAAEEATDTAKEAVDTAGAAVEEAAAEHPAAEHPAAEHPTEHPK